MLRPIVQILCLGGVCWLGGAFWAKAALAHDGVAHVADAGVAAGARPPILNGDLNGDGRRNIVDAIYLLRWIFAGGPEPVAIEPEDCGAPDPVADLIGYLDPNRGLLYVMQGYEDRVLRLAAAQALDRDLYLMAALTVDGQPYPLQFRIVRVEIPALLIEDCLDGEPTFIGEKGRYRFYKNAKCVVTSKAESLPCGPWPSSGPDDPHDGDQVTVEWNEVRKCREGTEDCKEVEQIWWTRKFYDDAACTVLVDQNHGKKFICKP